MSSQISPQRPVQLRLITLAHRVAHKVSGGRVGSLDTATHAPKGKTLRFLTRLHRGIYRMTGGIIGGNAGGLPTMLLTTVGRKSGQERTVPLPYFKAPASYGDAIVIVGSYAGGAKNPEWYGNIVANPEVTVQIGFRRRKVRAETVTPEQRAEIWPAVVAQQPMYAGYQRITERTIPVVLFRGLGTSS